MLTGSEFLYVPEIVKEFVLRKLRGAPVKKVTLYIWVKRTRMDVMQSSVIFFSTSEPNYTNLKTDPIKSKIM